MQSSEGLPTAGRMIFLKVSVCESENAGAVDMKVCGMGEEK